MDITVAIGRNEGDSPMSDTSWRAFRVVLWENVRRVGGTVTVEESGTAEYDHNGQAVQEETYRVWATIPDEVAPKAYMALRRQLERIAYGWKQWGIALSIVKTDIVAPTDREGSSAYAGVNNAG